MTPAAATALAAHTAAACLIGYGLFAGYRMVRERSEALGAVVALGMLARVALGVALFTISYGNLPIARSLHTGNGFWELAVDARHYYNAAATALGTHSFVPDPLAPSPLYVWVLTLWMFIVGVTPSAGALAVAAATCGAAGIRWYYGFIMWGALAVVLAWFLVRGRTTPLLTYLGGSVAVLMVVWLGFWGGSGRYYFQPAPMLNPARLLNVTQLARVAFLASGGGTNITAPLHSDATAGNWRYAELIHAQGAVPGVQERVAAEAKYLAEVSERSTAHTAELESQCAATPSSPSATPPAAMAATAPSPPSATAAAPVAATVLSQASPAAQVDGGGATTGAAHDERPPSASGDAAREVVPSADDVAVAVPVRPREQVAAAARGLAVIFVPISLLRTVTNIRIEGGRDLLSIVDFDTVVMNAVSVFVIALLWRRRRAIGDRLPLVLFGVTLSFVTALLVGHVVTNLGTSWRLRSLIAVPLWILVIALAPRKESHREQRTKSEQAIAG